MELVPPFCTFCKAPVPITDAETTSCPYCEATVHVLPEHRELRRRAEEAREKRREIEAALRELETKVPLWAPRVYKLTVIPAAVIGVPVLFAVTQSEYHWFAREWVVFAGILPFLVTLLPWLVLQAKTNGYVYLQEVGGKIGPAPPRPGVSTLECGVCGAPLDVEADAYAATCDYCLSDSWVRPGPGGFDHDEEVRRQAANLHDAVAATAFQQFDIRVLLITYTIVTSLSCWGLYALLPGRAALEDLRYSRSVDGEWERLGDPGPIIDLAVSKRGLVAIGLDGGLREYVDWRWRDVGNASGFLGVGGAGGRVLVVGHDGSAAWLREGRLEKTSTGLTTHLQDAWVGEDGSAVVVGSEGSSALFDGSTWTVLPQTNGNDLLAVWAQDRDHVWAVGGISVWKLEGSRWSGDILPGLPRIIDVSGSGDQVFIVTAPLDPSRPGAHEDPSVGVYAWRGGQWQHVLFRGNDFRGLLAGRGELWAFGANGYVQEHGLPPAHPPCPGDLRAAVFWRDSLVVGGSDGVFAHRE